MIKSHIKAELRGKKYLFTYADMQYYTEVFLTLGTLWVKHRCFFTSNTRFKNFYA